MANDNILRAPRKLEKSDDRSSFFCGVNSLDEWFDKWAHHNQRANNAVVYVSTLNDKVVGYYAIASGAVEKVEGPQDFANGRPNQIPVVILARLAVAQVAQGRGVGRALFRDALERTVSVSEAMGAAALVIHAHDEQAKNFYLHFADFKEFPNEPLHLLLPMKRIRGTIYS